MIRVGLLFLLVASAIAVPFSSKQAPQKDIDSRVLALTKDNFDETLRSNPMTLVVFYDPNTDDYRKLQLQYGRAALQLANENITEGREISKLDITKNKEIIDRFQFSEFPEFILFDQEDQLEFEDELSADALVQWVKSILSQPFKVIESAEQLEREVKVEELAKVFYYGPTDIKEFKTFERVAHLDRDTEYFVVSKPELLKNIWTPTVRVHATFHHPQAWLTYEGDWTKANLQTWIQDESLPIVVEMTERTTKYIFDDKSTTIFLVNSGDDSEAALGVMETLCEKDKSFTCGQLKKDSPMFESFTEFLGSAEEMMKSHILLLETKKMKMYRYKSSVADITDELLNNWLKDWRAGKLVQDNLGDGGQQPPKEEPACDSPSDEARSYTKTMEL